VSFEDRTSDRINEQGVAITIEGTFAGWIRRSNLAILNARRAQNAALTRTVVSRELREWPQEGGDNYRGIIDLD